VSAFNGGGEVVGCWRLELPPPPPLSTAHVPPQPQHFAEKPREEQLRMFRWDPAGGRRGGGNDGGLARTDGGEDVVGAINSPGLDYALLACSARSPSSLCSASASTSPPLHYYYQATTLPHSSLPSSHRLSSAFPLVLRIL